MTNLLKTIISEHLILEGRKEDAISKWRNFVVNSKITGLTNRHLNYVNPIINGLVTYDPSDNNKYLDWMCKMVFTSGWLNLGGISVFDTVWERLEYYHNNINRITPEFLLYINNLPNVSLSYRANEPTILKHPKDINSFPTTGSFVFFVDTLKEFKTKNDLKRDEKSVRDVVKIYESSNVLVVRPNTQEASCHYGAGTRWCTAATKFQNLFGQYSGHGLLVYILPKTKSPKLAIHIPWGEPDNFKVFNALDEQLSESLDDNIGDVIYPYVHNDDVDEIENSIWVYYNSLKK